MHNNQTCSNPLLKSLYFSHHSPPYRNHKHFETSEKVEIRHIVVVALILMLSRNVNSVETSDKTVACQIPECDTGVRDATQSEALKKCLWQCGVLQEKDWQKRRLKNIRTHANLSSRYGMNCGLH